MFDPIESLFEKIDAQKWQQKITKDLKERPFESLFYEIEPGLKTAPFYLAKDLKDIPLKQMHQAIDAWQNQKTKNQWQVLQKFKGLNDFNFNEIKEALKNEVAGIIIELEALDLTEAQLKKLEKLINDNPKTNWQIKANQLSPYAFSKLSQLSFNTPIQFIYDPLSLVFAGKFSTNELPSLLLEWEQMLVTAKNSSLEILGLDCAILGQLGLSPSLQIALTLALADFYWQKNKENNFIKQISLGISSSYLAEIAKVRALKILWLSLTQKLNTNQTKRPLIVGQTSPFEWANLDQNNNLLRGGVQAMLAVIGGVDWLLVDPSDYWQDKKESQALRLARNTQHIIKHESYLDQVYDPSRGSYFFENLTFAIANTAWQKYEAIANAGGLIQWLKSGHWQKTRDEEQNRYFEKINNRKKVMVGVNHYPLANEKLALQIDREPLAPKTNQNKNSQSDLFDFKKNHSLIQSNQLSIEKFLERYTPNGNQPIFKASLAFEKLRFDAQKIKKSLKEETSFYYLPLGKPAISSARIDFAKNFLGLLDFSEKTLAPQKSINDSLIKEIKANSPRFLVVASDDDSYPEILTELEKNKIELPLILVTRDLELKEKFPKLKIFLILHAKLDIYQTLENFLKNWKD